MYPGTWPQPRFVHPLPIGVLSSPSSARAGVPPDIRLLAGVATPSSKEGTRTPPGRLSGYYPSKRYCSARFVQQGGGQCISTQGEAFLRDQNRTIPFGTIVYALILAVLVYPLPALGRGYMNPGSGHLPEYPNPGKTGVALVAS